MVHAQAQSVVWPKLVARKLLHRRRSRSSCFIADLPCGTTRACAADDDDDAAAPPPASAEYSYSSTTDNHSKDGVVIHYKLFASTWNVGGRPPSGDLCLEKLLDTKNNSHDVYVLGFQEIVPLSPKNILGNKDSSKLCSTWNSLIRSALNKASSTTTTASGSGFECVTSKQMVGLMASVWARVDLLHDIRDAGVSCVGSGIFGCLGDKGSVSVRFRLQGTSFCFVCCHLASGGKEGDKLRRNSDAGDVLLRTTFPGGFVSQQQQLPRRILDHDRVILLGDLNYRISLPDAQTRMLVEQGQWETLLDYDQLMAETSEEGGVFKGWQEGKISFSPTYKYFLNSDSYYYDDHELQLHDHDGMKKKSQKKKKQRAPAWCDRIIWHGEGVKLNQYDRFESRLSDHRPVRAVFTVEVVDGGGAFDEADDDDSMDFQACQGQLS